LITRLFLGIILIIFGLNKFINFMSMPPLTDAAGQFMGGLAVSGYMFPLIALVEIFVGLSLLFNKYSSLMLVILMPVSLNIVLFHLFLAPEGTVPGLVILILNIYLLLINKEKFSAILSSK